MRGETALGSGMRDSGVRGGRPEPHRVFQRSERLGVPARRPDARPLIVNAAALFLGGVAAGLAAGTASCTVVQGGLLIGLIRPVRSSCCPPDATREARHRTTGGGSRRELTVVGAFLSARLLAHLAAGALLGLAGSAVQVGPQARAVLLVAAGVAVLVLTARLLLPGRGRRCGCAHRPAQREPEAIRGILRAAGLGFATILVPCGVTISMEIVAVSTGSALGGAAILAGFAIGTAPAFAALGLLVRGISATRSAARGVLTALTGVAALAAGIFTIGSGLRLGGWLPDLGSAATPVASAAHARQGPDGIQRLTIWATGDGFRPGIASAAAAQPIEIVFRTRDNRSCTRTLSIDGRDVVLPVTGEQPVRLPPQEPGRLRYACGMGMYVGFIRFESISGRHGSSQ